MQKITTKPATLADWELLASLEKIAKDGTILINGLTVLPEYRGKGIAHAALKRLLEDLGN